MKTKILLLILFLFSLFIKAEAACSVTINPSNGVLCIGSSKTLTAMPVGTTPFSYSWSTGETSSTITVTSSTGGTYFYSVTITDGTSCTSSASATVTVPGGFIFVGPSPSICPGQCVTLSASGTLSYSWVSCTGTNCPVVCPSVTTSYPVIVTDMWGCTQSRSIIVTVNPLPSITVSVPSPVCVAECVTLSSFGGSGYSWVPCTSTDCSIVCPTTTTTYTVVATDLNGCTNTKTVTVTVNPNCTAGVYQLDDESLISIFPNPLTASSTLHLTTPLKDAEVIIYDMLGKEMMRKRFSGNEMKIERGEMVSGVYFVRVRDVADPLGREERFWVEKIVVE